MAAILVVRADDADPGAIAEAAASIRSGRIVVYPTDTFYGLAADPRNAAAIDRLFEVKGRDRRQPSPLIASSLEQAGEAVELNDVARALAERFWPGPLSLVLPARTVIQRSALGGHDTAAIRVPAQSIARALASAATFCITATSANLSGRPPARSSADLSSALLERVDVVLDGGRAPGGAPSTIVDVTTDVPRLVRTGAVAWERVLESLQ